MTGTDDLGLPGSAADHLEAADASRMANGVVTVAYPFSSVPTRHLVELDGLPAVYSMRAIDALGLPFMAGRDGRITSADPHDGAAVIVSVRDGACAPSLPRCCATAAAATAGRARGERAAVANCHRGRAGGWPGAGRARPPAGAARAP